jgi:hypothetical protein
VFLHRLFHLLNFTFVQFAKLALVVCIVVDIVHCGMFNVAFALAVTFTFIIVIVLIGIVVVICVVRLIVVHARCGCAWNAVE